MLSPRFLSTFRLPRNIRQLLAAPLDPHPSVVSVSGWIKSIRRQKNVTFAVVTDGSAAHGLQAVFVGNADRLKSLTNGAAVRLSGKIVPSPGAGQDRELLVDLRAAGHSTASEGRADILGTCDPESYPIQKQALSTEYLRDHAHLRARTDAISAMIRLRNQLKRDIEFFFEDQGFCYTHTPVLTGSDAEGAGEAFELAESSLKHPTDVTPSLEEKSTAQFFGRPAYMTVSHQLHLEALATSLSRVYTLSPCFRAEPSLTGRHLAEFLMLEAEWAFGGTDDTDLTGVGQVCDIVEGCLRSVVNSSLSYHEEMDVLWKHGDENKRRALEDAVAAHEPWTRITYTEAINALTSHVSSSSLPPFHFSPMWGWPLQSEHERWLAETFIAGPLFITDYPRAIKPFYMRTNAATAGIGETVACVDLVIPHIGELVGGSVREERVDIVEENLGSNVDAEAYRWYLDLRRFGGAPHAGFGMGFERLVSWVAGIENIREAIPFPRWAGRMLL